MRRDIETMAEIMAAKDRELAAQAQPPMDDEGKVLAEAKRNSFDFPVNAVKVDPLR